MDYPLLTVMWVDWELSTSQVMETLVQFGAPEGILVNGKPHLGTDRLVPLLRNFRQHLLKLGVSNIYIFLPKLYLRYYICAAYISHILDCV